MTRLIERTWHLTKTLWHDTSGIMVPYVTVMLVVIIGLSLLAVDGGRALSLQTQMQSAADALALTGARELDRKAGARTRATNAINNLVANGLTGMGITTPVTVATPIFYSALPDASVGFTGTVATGDTDAVFVAVTTNPETVATMFPVSFLTPGGLNSFTAGGRAIAGNAGQQICKVPPVFICNPYETAGDTDAQATAKLEAEIQPGTIGVRRQFKILNDGDVGPGHFGWLIPPDGCNGANCLEEWISVNDPPACYSAGAVDLNTGAKEGALPGFNVRFDIGADASHAPDVNVRKQFKTNSGNWCNANKDDTIIETSPYIDTDSTETRAWGNPRDTVSTPLPTAGSIGNGQWPCAAYWSFNHQSAPAPTVRADGSAGVCGTAMTTTMSRHDVFQFEIDNGLVGDWSRGTSANNHNSADSNIQGESGQPLCNGAGNAGRRYIYAAVINCLAHTIPPGATADDIPAAGFVTYFLNEPVPTTGPAANRNLVGEMIGFANLSGGGTGIKATTFNTVQLYR